MTEYDWSQFHVRMYYLAPIVGGTPRSGAEQVQEGDHYNRTYVHDYGAINHLHEERTMELGAFSVSLSVKDIHASKSFYEKLGFSSTGGDPSQNWLIMGNGSHTIGLFQGMFDKNILTFNPGWGPDAKPLESFTDVRELQRRLKEQGVTLTSEADEDATGPASFMLVDPDGNPILVDQHV